MVAKKAYVLLRIYKNKKRPWGVVLKGKPPNGVVAYFRSAAAARKIQKQFKRFKRFGVYLIAKV